jgi:hypothetical protein
MPFKHGIKNCLKFGFVTQSPTEFKGGSIWNVVVNIHGALQATGLALLVLFFVIGVVKTCGSVQQLAPFLNCQLSKTAHCFLCISLS